jgi:serine/threonine-protein kinase
VEDTRLHRLIALILRPELGLDPTHRERFHREAQAAAALNYPNIVTVHSVRRIGRNPVPDDGTGGGVLLRELIPPSGLALEALLRIAPQVASAVAAAHQRGGDSSSVVFKAPMVSGSPMPDSNCGTAAF